MSGEVTKKVRIKWLEECVDRLEEYYFALCQDLANRTEEWKREKAASSEARLKLLDKTNLLNKRLSDLEDIVSVLDYRINELVEPGPLVKHGGDLDEVLRGASILGIALDKNKSLTITTNRGVVQLYEFGQDGNWAVTWKPNMSKRNA